MVSLFYVYFGVLFNKTKTNVLKMAGKKGVKHNYRDDIANIVAELHQVTPDYVRKIRRGEKENEEIMATIMDVHEAKNNLIKEVKRLIPVEKLPPKRPKTTLGDLRKASKAPQIDPKKEDNL